MMIFVLIDFFILFFFSHPAFSETSVSPEDLDRIDRLGDAFQTEAPWFRPTDRGKRSGEGQPQPPAYLSESPAGEPRFEPFPPEPSICYDPITRRYYYCFPDYPAFYEPIQFPYFPHPWKYFENCPPGFHWRPGWGCQREY